MRTFLPYQAELREAVKENKVVVVQKSRRIGYSLVAAAIAVEFAGKPKGDSGMNVYYMGYNLDMSREFITYCGEWAEEFEGITSQLGETFFNDPDHPERDLKVYRADLSSGNAISSLPSLPRALRGKQGLVIIDEAAFHDDLGELLKAAFALLMWGGRVLVISTHDGDTNPFNQLVQDIFAGRKPYRLLTCDLDRALSDGLYKLICQTEKKVWSVEAEARWREELIADYGDGADEELFCIPSRSKGTYLPGTLIEARSEDVPILRLELPDSFTHLPEEDRRWQIECWCWEELAPHLDALPGDLVHYLGEDFARSGDLSVLWPLQRTKDLKRRCPFLVELRNVPFESQKQIVFFLIDRLPRFGGGAFDATGNGAYLAEVCAQRYGSERILQVKLSDAWYQEHMPPFKAAFEDGMLSVPANTDVMDDHRAIKLIRGVPKVPRGERSGTKGSKRHGDSAIAHALAFAASRMEVEVFAYTPVRMRQEPDEDAVDRDIRITAGFKTRGGLL